MRERLIDGRDRSWGSQREGPCRGEAGQGSEPNKGRGGRCYKGRDDPELSRELGVGRREEYWQGLGKPELLGRQRATARKPKVSAKVWSPGHF